MLYIHIPFCKSRCIYCGFFSSSEWSQRQRYVDSICSEIEQRADYLGKKSLSSVYLGGGTPSVLSREEFFRIFQAIEQCFSLEPEAEVTVECNPDDITEEFLGTLRSLPINRVSFGVQSFCDSELRFLNRRHNAEQAREAVRRLKAVGIDNISIDLMYALHGQTLESWRYSISEALRLGVQHISAYCLTYEEDTPLKNMLDKGYIEAKPDDEAFLYYETLCRELSQAGFIHYEISNFALKGRASAHNSGYWQGRKYLGIGASAHSFDAQSRSWNIASIRGYIDGIERGENPINVEHLTDKDRFNEAIFLSLRTSSGLDLQRLKREFPTEWIDTMLEVSKKYANSPDLIELSPDIIRLTEKGFFLSDGIISDFFIV